MHSSKLAYGSFAIGTVAVMVQFLTAVAIGTGIQRQTSSKLPAGSGSDLMHQAYYGAIASIVFGVVACVVGTIAFTRLLDKRRDASGFWWSAIAVVFGVLALAPGVIEVALAAVAHAAQGFNGSV